MSEEEIGDDETVCRRIPAAQEWYTPESRAGIPPVSLDAFRPNANDNEGISLSRLRSERHPEFNTAEQIATGPSPAGYFLAMMQVRAIRQQGLTVLPDPLEGDSGHCIVPEIRWDSDKHRRKELQLNLTRLVTEVHDFRPE